MHKLVKYAMATVMAASLMFGQTSVAMAGQVKENTQDATTGPAFGIPASGNSQTSNTTTETSNSNPETNNTGNSVPSEIGVSGDITFDTATQPYIQVQLLSMDGNWSAPAVNGQTVYVGNSGFQSLCIYLNNVVGNVHYRTYASQHGWSDWAMNGQQTTIWGDPVEAVQIRLSGYARNRFNVYYSSTLSDGNALGWTSNGETSGAMANGKVMSGLKFTFWGKESTDGFPYSTANALSAATTDGVTPGTPATYSSGTGAAYTGWGWADTDRYYFVDNTAVTGWQYIDGYKYYFDETTGKLVTDLEPLIGSDGPHYIKINKAMNTLTVYAKDGDNGYIIPLKSFLCSTGDDTPLGEHKTPEKYRWRLMNTAEYCQYCTRLGAGLPILMHSVIYSSPNSYTLKASTYNYLGANKSHGCIRLTTRDAKWIFDHCPLGTTVYVYESNIPGPYERPAIEWVIPGDQTWDPTDPSVPEAAAQQ